MSTELEQAIEKLGTLESQLSGLSGLPADLIKFRKGISGGLTDIGRIVAGISTNRELQAPLDGVYYNANSPFDGVKQPVGSPRFPCNDWDDVLAMMADRGLAKAYVGSDLVLTAPTVGVTLVVSGMNTVDLGGQAVDLTTIIGGIVVGEQGAITVGSLLLLESLNIGSLIPRMVEIVYPRGTVGMEIDHSNTIASIAGSNIVLSAIFGPAVVSSQINIIGTSGRAAVQGSTSDTNGVISYGENVEVALDCDDVTAQIGGKIVLTAIPTTFPIAGKYFGQILYSYDEGSVLELTALNLTYGSTLGAALPSTICLDMTNITQVTTIRATRNGLLVYEYDFDPATDIDGHVINLGTLSGEVNITLQNAVGGGAAVDVAILLS